MLLCKRTKRQYLKSLGTSVINSPCSLAPWQYIHKNHRSPTLALIQIIKYTLIYSLDPNSNCLSNLEINVDFNAIVTILWNWKHLDDNIQDFWQRNNTTYRVFLFRGTKVLLYLIHLPLTEVYIQYLISSYYWGVL